MFIVVQSIIKFVVIFRIVVVSSHSHHKGHIAWKDVNFYKSNYGDGSQAYYQSKLANVMHAKELARRLFETGIRVFSVHPGRVYEKLEGPLNR